MSTSALTPGVNDVAPKISLPRIRETNRPIDPVSGARAALLRGSARALCVHATTRSGTSTLPLVSGP
jgi:hypothetical protein